MEHLFLLRSQAHELRMRQMVEEINLGRHTIESAMAKYQVLTRQTVTKWLERIRQEELARTQAMKPADPKPASTLVERVAQTADTLAGRVKQLEKELEQAELRVLYYKTVIRVAEQDLGVSIEKKSATK
jgi:transposase-like protein